MQIGNFNCRQSGFSLIGVLVLLGIIGLALGEAGSLFSILRQHEREQELLKIGDQFRIAIGRYYNESPSLVKEYPPSLQALLRDNRSPTPKRYLRKIPRDPINGSDIWGTVMSGDNRIIGVYSSSSGVPLKKANFRPLYKSFEGKTSYSDWRFTYVSQSEAFTGKSVR